MSKHFALVTKRNARTGETIRVLVEPDVIYCDICGRGESPADLTPDWNGDTGCHRSCERTHPPSKDDLAKRAGLGYHDYDTALPQGWVDYHYERTGIWAAHLNIVWDYRGGSLGRPLGLDPEAQAFLKECGEEA